MTEWRNVSLGTVLELKRGYDLPNASRRDGSVPVVSSSGPTGVHSEAKVAGPGVVTGRYGTLGAVFYITEDFWPLNTSLYVRDFKGNNPRYVAELLRTMNLGQYDGAAAIPGLNRNQLHTVSVRLPDLPAQEAIGKVAALFDELIENNRRRVQVLEEMARAIYREWFVKFRYPCHESVPFVDSPLGPIPEGWTTERVDSLLQLQRGFDLPAKDRTAGPIPVIGASGLQGGHDTAKANGPGVTTGRSGTVGVVTYVPDDFWPLNTALWVKEFRLATPKYAYFMLSDLDLRRSASGAAVPTLDRKVVHALPAVCPPSDLIVRWDSTVTPMFDAGIRLRRQYDSLAAVRDLLLPRLVTGQIDLSTPELDAVLEGAVA
jgi:type I restriction enzyme S subunit